MSDKRIKPGVTISKEVWENFKKAYPENTSRKLEELMSRAMEVNESPEYYSTSDGTRFTFENADNWNISWQNSSVVVSSYTPIITNAKEVIIKNGLYDKRSIDNEW